MSQPVLKTDPLTSLGKAQAAIYKLIDRTRFVDPDGASKARAEAIAELETCLAAVRSA